MEEEYSLPPDASSVARSPPVSSAAALEPESFYSEPLNASNRILNHHPASPFERVVRKSVGSGAGSAIGCQAENGESRLLCPRLQPVHTIGSVASPSHWAPVDPSLPLEDQPWFHGAHVDRQMAEQLLRPHPEGAFLVRCCQQATDSPGNGQQQYSLSLRGRHGQQCIHMRIERTQQGQYVLGQYSQPFASVPLMIRHYGEHLLPIKGVDRIILGMPVVDSAASRSNAAADG